MQCPILWYAKVCALPSTHSSLISVSLPWEGSFQTTHANLKRWKPLCVCMCVCVCVCVSMHCNCICTQDDAFRDDAGCFLGEDNTKYSMKPTRNPMVVCLKVIWEPADEQNAHFVFATLGFMPLSTNPLICTLPRLSVEIEKERKHKFQSDVCFCVWTAFLYEFKITFRREAKTCRRKKENQARMGVLFFLKAAYAWIWDTTSRLLHLLRWRYITTLAFREWMKAIFLIKTEQNIVPDSLEACCFSALMKWCCLGKWREASFLDSAAVTQFLCTAFFKREVFVKLQPWFDTFILTCFKCEAAISECFLQAFILNIRRGEARWISILWRQKAVLTFFSNGV